MRQDPQPRPPERRPALAGRLRRRTLRHFPLPLLCAAFAFAFSPGRALSAPAHGVDPVPRSSPRQGLDDRAPRTAATGNEDPGARRLAPVWCHDTRHRIVTRVARWRCRGTIVDSSAAERIREARRRRIRRVLERERHPVVPGRRLASTGSGFFVSSDGALLTNRHVVTGCAALTVRPASGGEVRATVVGADRSADLALLATPHRTRSPARFRPGLEIRPNEAVTVVGYPELGKVVIEPQAVSGRVHPDTRVRDARVFAMKIFIRRGSSGGPVLDSRGQVIGVVFAKIDTPRVYAATGRLIKDVGLALRLSVVRRFLGALGHSFRVAGDAPELSPTGRLALATGFVAQVGCWR